MRTFSRGDVLFLFLFKMYSFEQYCILSEELKYGKLLGSLNGEINSCLTADRGENRLNE